MYDYRLELIIQINMLKDEILFLKDNHYLMNPKIIQLELTNRCPLNCSQCYKNPKELRDMNFDLLKRLVSEASTLGVKRAMLNGGEPLLYPNLINAIKLLTQLSHH